MPVTPATARAGRKPRVLISSIDAVVHLPYQWALLKTYADEEPDLLDGVSWREPLHLSVSDAAYRLREARAFTTKARLAELDVLGLSCYVWNDRAQFRIAELAKAARPECVVVAGGPELAYRDPDFFRKHPQIDILVKKDGEIPFRKILRAVREGTSSFAHIPGLVIRESGRGPGTRAVDTGPSELLPRFHKSPWLHNRDYLETWVARHWKGGDRGTVVLETNRGCPYECAFCNWGVNTLSKIRLFELANIQEEVRWFAGLGIRGIHLADANFGILERDLKITEALNDFRALEPKPVISFYPAKNNPERAGQIATSLHSAGLLNTFYLGLPSTSPTTLAAIGRANMGAAQYRSLVDQLRKNGVTVYAGLVLGCPGETVESWKTTIAETIALGVDSLGVQPFQLLANSPADDPAYRAQWRIETMSRLGERSIRGTYICATRTFSRADYAEMLLYARAAVALFDIPEFRHALRSRCGESLTRCRAFLDGVYRDFLQADVYPEANQAFALLKEYLRDFVVEPDETKVSPFLFMTEGGESRAYNPSTFLRDRSLESPSFLRELTTYLGESEAPVSALSAPRSSGS